MAESRARGLQGPEPGLETVGSLGDIALLVESSAASPRDPRRPAGPAPTCRDCNKVTDRALVLSHLETELFAGVKCSLGQFSSLGVQGQSSLGKGWGLGALGRRPAHGASAASGPAALGHSKEWRAFFLLFPNNKGD